MQWVNVIDWHVAPFRADRFYEVLYPVVAKMSAHGATEWSLTRGAEDNLLFRQTSVWDDKGDFDGWWYDPEVVAARSEMLDWYGKPLLPTWHMLLVAS